MKTTETKYTCDGCQKTIAPRTERAGGWRIVRVNAQAMTSGKNEFAKTIHVCSNLCAQKALGELFAEQVVRASEEAH